jgi:trk system potassium uptake protein TrkA
MPRARVTDRRHESARAVGAVACGPIAGGLSRVRRDHGVAGRVGSSLVPVWSARPRGGVIDKDRQAFRRLAPTSAASSVVGQGFHREVLGGGRCGARERVRRGVQLGQLHTSSPRGGPETFASSACGPHLRRERAAVYERLGIPTVATVPWSTDRLLRHDPPRLRRLGVARAVGHRGGSCRCPCTRTAVGRPIAQLEAPPAAASPSWLRFGTGVLPKRDTWCSRRHRLRGRGVRHGQRRDGGGSGRPAR